MTPEYMTDPASHLDSPSNKPPNNEQNNLQKMAKQSKAGSFSIQAVSGNIPKKFQLFCCCRNIFLHSRFTLGYKSSVNIWVKGQMATKYICFQLCSHY